MQQAHYTELQDTLSNRISEAIPEAKPETVRDRIRAEFEAVRQAGKIDSLTPDEVSLLRDYRIWKATPGASIGGVFHWKKTDH